MKNNEIANCGMLNFVKNLTYWYKYMYICINSTHSASRKNSKWVFFFYIQSIQINIPPLPLTNAHLGGILFCRKPTSLTLNVMK